MPTASVDRSVASAVGIGFTKGIAVELERLFLQGEESSDEGCPLRAIRAT